MHNVLHSNTQQKVQKMAKPEEQLLSIRMPGALVKRLDRAAKQAERSRSAEVRWRLEQSLTTTGAKRAPRSAAAPAVQA
jgi:predicted DNA-binding protein